MPEQRELTEIFPQTMRITTDEGGAEYNLVAAWRTEPAGPYVEPPAPEPAQPPAPQPEGAPWVDVIATMPTNPKATNPPASPGKWTTRTKAQTRGITVHHTLHSDPVELARYITTKKQLPTTEYAVFIRENGEALLCVPLDVAFWHDHTGYPNYNVSIGLEGNRTKGIPAAQLASLARVAAYLMREYAIPVTRIKGHCDYTATACPGWNSGGWRAEFYDAVKALTK